MPCMLEWDVNDCLTDNAQVDHFKEDEDSFNLTLKYLKMLRPTSFHLMETALQFGINFINILPAV
jgi:hypothetical protein